MKAIIMNDTRAAVPPCGWLLLQPCWQLMSAIELVFRCVVVHDLNPVPDRPSFQDFLRYLDCRHKNPAILSLDGWILRNDVQKSRVRASSRLTGCHLWSHLDPPAKCGFGCAACRRRKIN